MAIFAPTLACADPLNLEENMRLMEHAGAKMWHIDIMDGHYVPNLCFSFEQAIAIQRISSLPVDVHLMVQQPERWIGQLEYLRPHSVAFHVDATSFPIRMIRQLKERDIRPGIALNPGQPVSILKEILPLVDYILLMAVEPGYSGQRFLTNTFEKLKQLNWWRIEKKTSFSIMVDGGIDFENAPCCVRMGADILIGGTFVWGNQSEGIENACKSFINCIEIKEDELGSCGKDCGNF